MLKLYKYLYYRLYSWNLKKWGEKDGPEWNALLGVAFMMYLNILVFIIILDILGIYSFIEEASRIEIILLFLMILATNYFRLFHKGKYKQIAKEYENEPKEKRFKRAALLWLYVIMSFVIVCFEVVLSARLKGLR